MQAQQGDVALLDDPIAQELLHSAKVAHLAYVWSDGTPRVVPLWFHWNGAQLVLGTPSHAPKMHILKDGSYVALTIETDTWPYHVLLIRGIAAVNLVDGVADEYVAAAQRYFGHEQGDAWIATMRSLGMNMYRIVVYPQWVGILDFEQRFPSAIAEAMATMAHD
jgi:hypothetical protein